MPRPVYLILAAILPPLIALVMLWQLPAQRVTGIAVVVDGETIRVNGELLRLRGITTPAIEQPCRLPGQTERCGMVAAQALSGLLGDQFLICVLDRFPGIDAWGRLPARCLLSDGRDVGSWMVRSGYALAAVFEDHAYLDEHADAWRERRGLWSTTFEYPVWWRLHNQHMPYLHLRGAGWRESAALFGFVLSFAPGIVITLRLWWTLIAGRSLTRAATANAPPPSPEPAAARQALLRRLRALHARTVARGCTPGEAAAARALLAALLTRHRIGESEL